MQTDRDKVGEGKAEKSNGMWEIERTRREVCVLKPTTHPL